MEDGVEETLPNSANLEMVDALFHWEEFLVNLYIEMKLFPVNETLEFQTMSLIGDTGNWVWSGVTFFNFNTNVIFCYFNLHYLYNLGNGTLSVVIGETVIALNETYGDIAPLIKGLISQELVDLIAEIVKGILNSIFQASNSFYFNFLQKYLNII